MSERPHKKILCHFDRKKIIKSLTDMSEQYSENATDTKNSPRIREGYDKLSSALATISCCIEDDIEDALYDLNSEGTELGDIIRRVILKNMKGCVDVKEVWVSKVLVKI